MQCVNPNCSAQMLERDVQFVLKMMLCRSCAIMFREARAHVRSEAEAMLASLDDTLQALVMQGQAHALEGRDKLLEGVVRTHKTCRIRTTSTEYTRPVAHTADGRRKSNKPSAQG